MPSHVYVRVGDYDAAARANRAGMRADAAYRAAVGEGMYALMYGAHNMHFLAFGEAMAGRYASASQAADALHAHLAPVAKEVPGVDPLLATRLLLDVKFRRWDAVLATPEPPFEQPQGAALWHFGRGMAFARRGNGDAAARELASLVETTRTLPRTLAAGNNAAREVLRVAEALLTAALARSRGEREGEIAALQEAVRAADGLAYDEPPAWYLFPRESLGGAWLRHGDAVAAEAVFRDELARNRNNGRALFGLEAALRAQARHAEARDAQAAFTRVWHTADTALAVDDL
jgi:hypothetical protein